MDYIKREKLKQAMYHEAFETDTELQKWESGCWIRYKLFENVIDALPAANVEEIIRCKECIYWNAETKDCKRNPSIQPWWETDFCSYGEKMEE